jgi:AhpD family alkylhydroperoxidase
MAQEKMNPVSEKSSSTSEGLFAEFRRLSPVVTGGVARMRQGAYAEGVVKAKYKILTALVASVILRCEPCIQAYAEKAREAGAEEAEVIEFLNVAMAMQGCPGEEWALKALAAFRNVSAGESCCTVEPDSPNTLGS